MVSKLGGTTSGDLFERRLTRRRIFQAAGAAGLAVLWSSATASAGPGGLAPAGPGPTARARAVPLAQQWGRTPPKDLDSWLRINPDGSVTLCTGKVEFGQGIQTGFAQLVAEELDVPFEQVQVIMGVTDQVPYDNATVGSMSTRATGPLVRQAAAEMRRWLLELGSAELGLPADQLATRNGAVVAGDGSNASASYADLAAGKLAARQMTDDAILKDPATFTVVGQSLPRLDIPDKVTGAMKYGFDATVPGMVHGKIVRPPSLGATLVSIDFGEAEKMPGVVGVYRDGDFAAIAAERLDQAQAALAAVKATWNERQTGNTSENLFDLIKRTADAGEVLDEQPGEPERVLPLAAKTVTATFRAPYVSHSPIESMAALVDVQPDTVRVWTSTQSPFGVQAAVAEALGRSPESVVVTTMMSGGAFGRKSIPDAAIETARLAQAIGRPVRLTWTREEDFQFGRFRPAAQIEVRSGLDEAGNVVGWQFDLYTTGYYPEGAAEPTRCGANAGADALELYALPNARTTWYQGHSPLPPHFWRANGDSANSLARETVIDELAELAGTDPVTFRTRLLANNPRLLAVMQAAVEKAGWTPGVGPTGKGFGLALAFANGTYVAEVAQVAVDEGSGKIQLKHVDVALDCGLVVNPDAVRNQTEGGVILSASATLKEAITFANGKVTNASFAQYGPLTMLEAPTVDVVFVEDKTQPMAGIGEPAVPPLPPAVANAVYDAVGVRLREMPFTPNRVLAALATKQA